MNPRCSRPALRPAAWSRLLAASLALALAACQSKPRPGTVAQGSSPAGPSFAQGYAPPAPGADPHAAQPVLASYPGHPGPASSAYDPQASPPAVTARAAIVVQANTGKVLYARNADTRVPAASTQKLLTALLVAERGNLEGRVTVAASDTHCEPTKMGIQPGQTYKRIDLLNAVLIRSSNDIARCLARDHSGSESAFAAAMNARARQLGMNNSYFTNSNGLPSPGGQYSTARDLSILAAAAMRHQAIRDAVRTQATTFTFSDGRSVPLTNTNRVLKSLPQCTGLKTGYTHAAGRCLVSSASHNGKNVIVVILGSQTPQVWTESEALLRWGLGL